MEETAQNFEKRFFINRSYIFIALPKFYVTHGNYEILSKSLVPSAGGRGPIGKKDCMHGRLGIEFLVAGSMKKGPYFLTKC
jgi:hypothetical protein